MSEKVIENWTSRLDYIRAGRGSPMPEIIFKFGLAIHQNDHQARHRFVEWAQNKIAVVHDFHQRILFSDEAHFWLNGYVNKLNCRIWSETNPQVYVETPLHPEKLTVWCALWAGGIIGPYFFKNNEGHNVTVNGDRYRAMITNFFIPELNNHDIQELWFQQDGATCHTARATIDLFKDTFGDRLISRFGPVNRPPRSCDLTPLDYFLWSYVKSLVYADKPQTLDHLEDNIRRVIADIRPQMLEKVCENWTSRLDYIRASHGSHMPEIILKIIFPEEEEDLLDPRHKIKSINKTSRGGRVRSTTPAEDRYIVLSAKRNRRTTAQQVANQFLAASGKQISRKTVARRLTGGGLYARRPVVCVTLTRQHRTARLQWCREHHNWTEQDWAYVLFSDESRFSLSSGCRRQVIGHESGTAYRPENIQEKD
ncbi:putative transposable element [Trichonephila clavipes]|uniref:Putative transposable element n=1 Tax=Trichonephila clavipes TaxID=2585209 RepID=A0A8X6S2Q2_TRICX|nr:putative transposable element [Trichonephila clavipes]